MKTVVIPLTLQTTLGTLGTNEIQAELQDAEWKDIVKKKIEITVNEGIQQCKRCTDQCNKSKQFVF